MTEAPPEQTTIYCKNRIQTSIMPVENIPANDTICAVSTPAGIGGIAVVRVSGPHAIQTVEKLWTGKKLTTATTHTAHLGHINHINGDILDQAVATIFRSPGSYTGEDTVEISVHGSLYIQQAILQELCKAGARLADPGEFTRRAFVAGKIDLTQAEAVADILAARTQAAHKLAVNHLRGGISKEINTLREKLINLSALLELELDFSEEDVEFADRTTLIQTAIQVVEHVKQLHNSYTTGSAIKNGIPIAIVGATNAGKSSLLNTLLNDDRAIVSDIHGTTRDIIEDTIILNGHTFRLMDTAGIRDTDDTIEQLGIERSRNALQHCSIALLITSPDTTIPPTLLKALPQNTPIVLIQNKADQTTTDQTTKTTLPDNITPIATLTISAKYGQGIDKLKEILANHTAHITDTHGEILISNQRQQQQLAQALEHAQDTVNALQTGIDTVITAQSLRATINALSTLTGQITTPAILTHIFSHFCIGK